MPISGTKISAILFNLLIWKASKDIGFLLNRVYMYLVKYLVTLTSHWTIIWCY